MTIQISLEPKDGETSSPIHVLEDNSIEWADLDENTTLKLLGFVNYFSTARKEILDVDYQIFRDNYFMGMGKYPVFVNQDGEWVSVKQKVTAVEDDE